MKKILVATDFSAASFNAAHYATDLANAWNAGIVLLHVAHVPVSVSEIPVVIDEKEIMEDAKQQMEDLKKDLKNKCSSGLNIEIIIDEGSFYHFLKMECEEINPVLVIIGMQGKSPMQKMFFGSNAEHVLQELRWPVLAIPPKFKFTLPGKMGLASDLKDVKSITPVDTIKFFVEAFHSELHILNVSTSEKFDAGYIYQSNILQDMFAPFKAIYHFTNGPDPNLGILNFIQDQQLDFLIVLPKKHNIIFRWLQKSHTYLFAQYSPVPLLALHP